MNNEKVMEAVAATCQQIGRAVPLWTQGAGSNVSCKANGILYIKASGFRLDFIRQDVGIVGVDIESLKDLLSPLISDSKSDSHQEKAYADALKTAALTPCMRPSMETAMHLFLPATWVVHFHALSAILMAHCAEENYGRMASFFCGQGVSFACIESTMPGLDLAKSVARHTSVDIILLAQHGVILQGPDASRILRRWQAIERNFARQFDYNLTMGLQSDKCLSVRAKPSPWRVYFPDTALHADRIKRLLVPAATLPVSKSPLFELKEDAFRIDRDSAELWWATSLLYNTCSQLKSISDENQAGIQALPTERYRSQMKSRRRSESQ